MNTHINNYDNIYINSNMNMNMNINININILEVKERSSEE